MSKLTDNITNILMKANKLVEQMTIVILGLERGEFSVSGLLQSEFLEPVQQLQQPEQSLFSQPNQKILKIYRR